MLTVSDKPCVGRTFYKVFECQELDDIIINKYIITDVHDNAYISKPVSGEERFHYGDWSDYLNDTIDKAKKAYIRKIIEDTNDIINYILDLEYTDETK